MSCSQVKMSDFLRGIWIGRQDGVCGPGKNEISLRIGGKKAKSKR